ncbi:MAG: hypothetical protein ACLU0O_02220 [Collinsella sp.]
MAGLFNILKVTVSEDKIEGARAGEPRHAARDLGGYRDTARGTTWCRRLPSTCACDSGREFQDRMGCD